MREMVYPRAMKLTVAVLWICRVTLWALIGILVFVIALIALCRAAPHLFPGLAHLIDHGKHVRQAGKVVDFSVQVQDFDVLKGSFAAFLFVEASVFLTAVMLAFYARAFAFVLKLVQSVAHGTVFSMQSVVYLTRIGQILLIEVGIDVLDMVLQWIAPHDNGHNATGFDGFGTLVMALLAFVLAHAFREAALMRDELESVI